MAQEMEEKEKARAYVAQAKRNHQVCSLGDEDEEMDNKRKRKFCMVETSEEDGSTNLKKKYFYMEKDGTLSII